MFIALIVVHVMICTVLVLVVLVQSGRGAELGAAFGGLGQANFGRTPATFLSKFTTGLAALFMVTSLSLALLNEQAPSRSLLKDVPAQGAAAPATMPGSAPAGGSAPLPGAPTAATPAAGAAAPASAPLQQAPAPASAPQAPARSLPQTPAPAKG